MSDQGSIIDITQSQDEQQLLDKIQVARAKTRSERLYYIFAALAVVFTTLSGCLVKWMGLTKSREEYFSHPFFQTAMIYLGMYICQILIFIYQCTCYSVEKEKVIKENVAPPLFFVVPILFDVVGSMCVITGIIFCALSVVQMLHCMVIVSSALFSRFYLKNKFLLHRWMGLLCMIIGMILAGIATLLSTSNSESFPIGVILVVVGNTFFGIEYIVQEILFKKYEATDTLEALGYEGAIGFALLLIILPILQSIPCRSSDIEESGRGICNFGKVENSIFAMIQILSNTTLIGIVVGYIISISLANWFVIGVVKYGGAIGGSAVQAMKIVLTWITTLIIGWETFQWLELVSMIILIIGVFIFHWAIIPKFEKAKIDH